MAHYRVIPQLPPLPAEFGVDELDLIPTPQQRSAVSSPKLLWLLPLLILAIAALCLAWVFLN